MCSRSYRGARYQGEHGRAEHRHIWGAIAAAASAVGTAATTAATAVGGALGIGSGAAAGGGLAGATGLGAELGVASTGFELGGAAGATGGAMGLGTAGGAGMAAPVAGSAAGAGGGLGSSIMGMMGGKGGGGGGGPAPTQGMDMKMGGAATPEAPNIMGGIKKGIGDIVGGILHPSGPGTPGQAGPVAEGGAPAASTYEQASASLKPAAGEKPAGFLGLTDSERNTMLKQGGAYLFNDARARQQATQGGQVPPMSPYGLMGMQQPQGMAEGGELAPGQTAQVGDENVTAKPGGGATVTPPAGGAPQNAQAEQMSRVGGPQTMPGNTPASGYQNPTTAPGPISGAPGAGAPHGPGVFQKVRAFAEDALIFGAALQHPEMFMQMNAAKAAREQQQFLLGSKDPSLFETSPAVRQAGLNITGSQAALDQLTPTGHNIRTAELWGFKKDPSASPAENLEAGGKFLDTQGFGRSSDTKGFWLPNVSAATYAEKSSGFYAKNYDSKLQELIQGGMPYNTAAVQAAQFSMHTGSTIGQPPPQWLTALAHGQINAQQAQDGRNKSDIDYGRAKAQEAAGGRTTGTTLAKEDLPVPMDKIPFMFDSKTGQQMRPVQPVFDTNTGQQTGWRPTTMSDVRMNGVQVSPAGLRVHLQTASAIQHIDTWVDAANKLFPANGNQTEGLGQLVMRGATYQWEAFTKGAGVPSDVANAIISMQLSHDNMLNILRGAGGELGRVPVDQLKAAEGSGAGFYETRVSALARPRFYLGLAAATRAAGGLPLSPTEGRLMAELDMNAEKAGYPKYLTSQLLAKVFEGTTSTATPGQRAPEAVVPKGATRQPGSLPPGVTSVEVIP